ncbi:uncharacterized protein LOC119794668 isoform X2 [Cyprinodon tularosa]|uniref:uncharacterized protein LOC119794668 isoform X2 n=1 Tax=Cyprinodon tularosa TaxID=77115 RepID=UPI0018E1E5D9|nr:uncharacterized protein LOC119794668 isoform X2 [Cyprinodon tularosa]
MASTSQTALEYLSNARVHLVGKLRNHLVILENLYQKGVLHDEEVNKIKTEKDDYDKNRALLDSVIKKGEASCYQLLRILYETRRRTLERPGSDETTAKEFNLHQWICCFSFKEEAETDTNYLQGSRPCHRYQSKLKSKGNKLSRDFWKASNKLFQNQNPDLSYTPLVLDTNDRCSPSKIKKYKTKKSKLSRPKKLRAYIPEDIPEISPTRLLKMDKDILLVGKPGTGKTALSHEMLRLWSERDDKELDYMFYFDMREMTNIPLDMSLEDLLFNCYSKPDEGRDEILEDIERNSENVTIILDGVTDLSSSVMKKLVEKDLLSHAKIIITCRPDDEEDLCLEDWFRVEVKGFSEGTIKTYLSKALGEDHQEVLSNVELLTLSHVPMYALMVAASFSSGVSLQPKTVTEIYINIVRFSLQMNSNGTRMKNLNQFIRTKRDEIMSLAEAAFEATQRKTVNLEGLSFEDSCILSFRKSLDVKVALTETMTVHAFLHYTMQEFFAALWLLKNPEKIREVFQQSLTEEMKHMKHVIPFMCQLLNEENPSLMSCLVPDEKLVETQEWFFKEMIDTFFQKAHDSELYVDTLFLCQCLYESQSSEACIAFLDKLNFHLDLSGENLDPHSCQAVAFMVTQSKERKISLNLKDVTVSEQGMRQLLRCLQHVKWCDSLPQQLWRVVLLSNGQTGYKTLLDLCENQLHLSVVDKKMLFENAVKVMQREDAKVTVCLHWVRGATVCQSLSDCLLQALPKISNLRFDPRSSYLPEQTRFLVNLFCAAAEREQLTGEKMVELLASVCRYETFIIYYEDDDEDDDDDTIKYPLHFLLDLYSQMKDCETKTGLSLLPSLQSVFQSAPPVWIIKLSEIQTSILLEVLKLQSEKKPVKLTDCSHGESEVRSFLQCLPYISQLRFDWSSDRPEQTRFLVNLFCAAAEREQLTGEKMVELLASVCRYETFIIYYQDDDEDDDDDHIKYRLDFLLDLYFQMKDCETKTGLSLLPSLQSVFQSAPPEWTIDLSERKTSILLEVLKLQSEKKPVKLTDCSHGESEVRSFLQCLPYISQLRFDPQSSYLPEQTRFLVNLFCAAAEREQLTGEKMVELLASVCRYETFPLEETYMEDGDVLKYQSHFLLDLYSQMKDCETKTGLSLLPSLQSVFQSAPPVWIIKLSEIQTSILLEVLKLQSEKKPVELTDCSHGESEVRSFLQWLPYISKLRFYPQSSDLPEQTRFLVNLFCAAAEREQLTGEKMVELLASVCRYETFPFYGINKYQSDILLDLYSQMKDCETKTGLSLLPSLQSVFQSAPPEWTIKLSEIQTSILLEVLKLQSEKKPVKLTDCSHGESEVRSFLQCLPYISQLRFDPQSSYLPEQTRFLVNLFCAAAEREQLTGEKMVELLASVCRYETFPFCGIDKYQSHFLLDLYSQMKDCETKTGLSLLPSLQSVFQSAPPEWTIDLSERKTSILLEVLKLQSEKKPVKLTDCSHGESEVRSFLQCLPYISKLRFDPQSSYLPEQTRFLVNLFCAAAEREQLTGEKMVELLASVCRYETFPLEETYMEDGDVFKYQSHFLLDLYSQMKDCETKTGLSLLPSLQSVFQSAPPVWIIKLSEIQTSILLEVLKLQSEKKPVKLTDCSHGESEVRSFLQWLPYISQLSCDPGFFQIVCSSTPFRSREEVQQLVSLLQLLNFNLRLTGELGRKTCSPVGRVLRLCGSKVDLILTARKMSVRGASVLFRSTTQLHSLRLSNAVALFLSQWVRRGRVTFPLVVEELSVVSTTAGASKRALLKVGSSLASLLRFWTVRRLDLTKSRLPTQSLFSLLLHDAPLSVRLSEDVLQQLVFLLHEVQDQDLTLSFLKKVGGDLSSCRLKWEMLHYLLQQPSDQTITVNLKKNSFLQERAPQLLPFLHRMVLQRPRPSFVRTSIREISRALSSHMIPALLRSLDHVIDLNCTELDSEDCAALLFILRHSDGVKLKLLWSSIPAEGIQSILHLLHKVSDLSVDRKQLLSFIHCCAASDSQQEAAAALLRTLQHSVDLSCSSCVELAEEEQKEPLRVTAADCRAVSSILRHSSRDTQLHLRDCEVEDSGLDLLFPVLDRVRLRVSKTVLVQLLSLLTVGSERDTVRRAVSLCRALGGELDLSHSTLDQRLCAALVLMLDYSEGLTELDLSHCQLTDLLLLQLITHLHKVKVLDLSHNQITDASTDQLLLLVSINPSIGSVRLFNNNILNRTPYKDNRKFEMW